LQVAIRQDLNVPPALWATDTRSGKAKKLWDPNPELSAMQVGEASVYHWKDSTGYDWSASLIKPVGYGPGKRYPLIIQTHGFHNEHEFITDGAYTTAFAARPLAAAGFMVLETRDRHDHDVTSEEAPTMVRGFESAIDALNAEGLIDAGKVGIIGFSRTCYYTESALIHAPQRYAAAVMADGVDESYMTYLLWGEGRDVREQEAIYGTPPFGEGMKKWVEAAPGFNLNRVQTPLLIQAITAPSILEEWEIYASLRLQKKPVEMIYFPDGQHILQKPLERLASQQSDVDWFRFWLQGYEDSDLGKVEQYKRWEKLCDIQVDQNPNQSAFCVRSKSN
jgi:dipeptidyl aminopeptidase/acylaminoacyl peptidase